MFVFEDLFVQANKFFASIFVNAMQCKHQNASIFCRNKIRCKLELMDTLSFEKVDNMAQKEHTFLCYSDRQQLTSGILFPKTLKNAMILKLVLSCV